MEGYLGETVLNIHETKYAMYGQQDWAMMWIERYGWIGGAHHKAWLIDQIARIIKSTNIIMSIAKWENGDEEYRFNLDEPTKEYLEWVEKIKDGEDGPDTYSYDFGVAP